jgi:hypothetical protein
VAAAIDAPILLVTKATIPSATAGELARLGEAPCPKYPR